MKIFIYFLIIIELIFLAFLDNGDYNVIVVDWENLANLSYKNASKYVKLVGGYIAKMIDYLESLGNNLNDMVLVGFSLGAQVVGLAGYQTKNQVGLVVGKLLI